MTATLPTAFPAQHKARFCTTPGESGPLGSAVVSLYKSIEQGANAVEAEFAIADPVSLPATPRPGGAFPRPPGQVGSPPQSRHRVALYARVSTTDQRCEAQLAEIRQYAVARGWPIAAEYVDDGMSGANDQRPELLRLLSDARKRPFDIVLVHKLDRWGRSLRHCLNSIEELRALGIRWIALTQNLDTDESNPTSQLLLHIMAAFAEFERGLIHERVLVGIRAAQSRGTRSGRPIGRPRKVFRRDVVLELRRRGLSWRQIALETGVSTGSVRRAYRTLADASQGCQNPGEGDLL